ncbi:MAG: PIN domain-containing protein [Candidatus Delongbacteria bacterium]|nr:PIN domain-containing protein [Candidatus Delongbacteria bacterium]MCG2761045.1 PIN domain-containing protein [Candidatus Delongbacteria bacterium]
MIIADTSIWIDFFRNKLEEKEIFLRLIENDYMLMPEVVAGELLQGAKSDKEVRIIKSYVKNLRNFIEADLFIVAGEYSYKNNLINKGIGFIDAVIIATAIRSNSKIWTKDLKLKEYLEKRYIYEPSLYSIYKS